MSKEIKNTVVGKSINIAFRFIFSRTVITILLLIIQAVILFIGYNWLSVYMSYILTIFSVLGAVLIIYIINDEENPAFKLSWILPICVFPAFGAMLFLFVKLNIGTVGMRARLNHIEKEIKPFLKTTEDVKEKIKQNDSDNFTNLSYYLENVCDYHTYANTRVEYYKVGEEKFEAMKNELRKAKKFIFLEYFIISKGYMWNSILEILKQKVREGVEVRVMYDGMCSLVLLPYNYPKFLEQYGIKSKMFAPIRPLLSTHQNYRDHRKILVIDGNVAFCGGINISDEYININSSFGHWKDVAIKLEGSAVKSFTKMFLQMWNVSEYKKEQYAKYLYSPVGVYNTGNEGFVIPYGDGPNNKENIAENVYLDMIYKAKSYLHIMTPYLIIDNELVTALTYAAKRGVDVKLILPHIPDKKYAFYIARTFYPQLINAGIKIYEYSIGFVHAKVFVSDGNKATVGTINLDYRSLVHHFECGAFIYKNAVIQNIEQDFNNTLTKCICMTIEDYKKINVFKRIAGKILRMFSALM